MSVKVSVIMATKNSEGTIGASLRSLEQQSQKSLELVVIDSASTDSTIEIVRSSRVDHVILSEIDDSIYEAFNKGLSIASGDWIMFLGSDDEYLRANSIEQLLSNPGEADLVYGSCIADSKVLKNTFDWRLLKGNSMNHQGVAYSRSIFEKYQYDTSYRIAADYKLNLELYLKGIKSKHIDIEVARFSMQGTSNKFKALGLAEQDQIRLELLGQNFGTLINKIQSAKRFINKQNPRISQS